MKNIGGCGKKSQVLCPQKLDASEVLMRLIFMDLHPRNSNKNDGLQKVFPLKIWLFGVSLFNFRDGRSLRDVRCDRKQNILTR